MARPQQLRALDDLVTEAKCLGAGMEWRDDLYEKVKAFWYGAKARCTKPSHPSFRNYGARGIECRFGSPDDVIAAIGLPPSKKHSVDRIDGSGHYVAGNVRWATQADQCSNLRTNAFVTIDGVVYKRVDLVRQYGISHDRVDYGAKRGWSLDKITSREKQYDTSSLPLAEKAAAQKRASQTNCKRGHPLDGANLYAHSGRRHCRACRSLLSKGGI